MTQTVNGILLLDKPAGLSSNQALQRVKHLFAAKKAGHTGSLDPIATGMLPICFGEATKFSQFLLEADKTYQVLAQLGVETTTGDSEGEITNTLPVNTSVAAIEKTLNDFRGAIEQIPPMYSAIKHQGIPLYKLARKGMQIERKARQVTIFNLTLEEMRDDCMRLYVHCTKGTYIRSLVSDIGNKLGCGAHVVALRRLTVSPFDPEKMSDLTHLQTVKADHGHTGLLDHLLAIEASLSAYPKVNLSSASIFYLKTGQAIRVGSLPDATLVRLHGEDNRFFGVGMVMADGRIKPQRLIQ